MYKAQGTHVFFNNIFICTVQYPSKSVDRTMFKDESWSDMIVRTKPERIKHEKLSEGLAESIANHLNEQHGVTNINVIKSDAANWCVYKISDKLYNYARILDVKCSKVIVLLDSGFGQCATIASEKVVYTSSFKEESLRKTMQLNGELECK